MNQIYSAEVTIISKRFSPLFYCFLFQMSLLDLTIDSIITFFSKRRKTVSTPLCYYYSCVNTLNIFPKLASQLQTSD